MELPLHGFTQALPWEDRAASAVSVSRPRRRVRAVRTWKAWADWRHVEHNTETLIVGIFLDVDEPGRCPRGRA